MYPIIAVRNDSHYIARKDGEARRTLLLVDTEDDDDFVAADADEFLDGADAPPRELGEQDHALDVVVLELQRARSCVGARAIRGSER